MCMFCLFCFFRALSNIPRKTKTHTSLSLQAPALSERSESKGRGGRERLGEAEQNQ